MLHIAFLNSKGGVGKSMLSINVARAMNRYFRTVLLIDSDPGQSVRDWERAVIQAKGACPIKIVGLDTHRRYQNEIGMLMEDHELIVTDGMAGSNANDMSTEIMRHVQLVLIPIPPSAVDERATRDFMHIIKRVQAEKNGMPYAAIIINRVNHGTKSGKNFSKELEKYGFPVLNQKIYKREIYASSFDNTTIIDDNSNRAAVLEIENLTSEILTLAEDLL